MKFIRVALIFYILPFVVYSQETRDRYFLSNPCLNPAGDTVVFSYAGDLWKSSIQGGNAIQLTKLKGYETNARYSPDGKWISFTAHEYGNGDVFVMPSCGGTPLRITYHSADDNVNSWSWDSKYIYFSSDREGPVSGYKVLATGGTPIRVMGHYFFQNDHNLFEDPKTGAIFFNNTLESSLFSQRKGYKGSNHPAIQSYDPVLSKYRLYSNYSGKFFGATLDRYANIYFTGDKENGEFNIYTIKSGEAVALTHFSNSIKSPVVSANGTAIVFERGYQLFLYDIKTRVTKKINPLLPDVILKDTIKDDLKGRISYIDLSPNGKKIALISRGELFICDSSGNNIHRLNIGYAERALEVKWLADGSTLIFSRTSEGFANWFTMRDDGEQLPKQITNDKYTNRFISLNADRTMAVCIGGREEIKLIDLSSFVTKTIAKGEIWAIWNDMAQPRFSPDGAFISYTTHFNMEEDIMLFHIPTAQTVNLTKTASTETGVFWSHDNKYLFFAGGSSGPAFPQGIRDARIFRVQLQKYNLAFDSALTKNISFTGTVHAASLPELVDTIEVMQRMEMISPDFGSQYPLASMHTGNQSYILYMSNHDKGVWAIWKTTFTPGKSNKTEKVTGIEDRRFGAMLCSGDSSQMALVNGNVYRLDLAANHLSPLNIHFTYAKSRMGEFEQMFAELCSKINENYYDPSFHGKDWNVLKETYHKLLPYIHTRDDYRILVNDLLGELNSSHVRFNTNGDDEKVDSSVVTMETGIMFDDRAPFVVKYILSGSAADKKEINLQTGDLLISVNGEPVNTSVDRSFYFTKYEFSNILTLSFSRNGRTFQVMLHPQRSITTELYNNWIRKNQKRVSDKTGNRIAYVFMKNMEPEGYEKFVKDMEKQYPGKYGLILDLRYNDGGLSHDNVLRYLSQRSYAKWKYRGGSYVNQGIITPADNPITLLINEQTLSDGEITAAGFQALGLGTTIGNTTYGWEIFTLKSSFPDGSSMRVPCYGVYKLNGKELERIGVTPDIRVVNSFDDNLHNRDPQLDAAIADVLRHMKERKKKPI